MNSPSYLAYLFFVCLFLAQLIYPVVLHFKTRIKSIKRATHYFDALQKAVGRPYEKFVLSKKDRDFLIEHNYSPQAIYHLIVLIMLHLNMPFTRFYVKVMDGTGSKTAGRYSPQADGATIEVHIEPHFTGEQIIAIVCHECAHHFLRIKKSKGEPPKEMNC